MPSFFRSTAALAMLGAAFANPLDKRYSPDSCAAAVTGKAALGDDKLRQEHCSSYFKTIVTPAAVTVTTTITDKAKPTGWENFKRDVTLCPNEVPNYASACDDAGYSSACRGWGISYDTTFTIPATTTTKSVYIYGTGSSFCGDKTVVSTKTETSKVAGSTTTVAGSTSTVTVAGSTATTTKTVLYDGGKGNVTVTTTLYGGGANKTATTTVTSYSTVTVSATAVVNATVTVTSTAAGSTGTTNATYSNTTVPAAAGLCLTAEKAKSFTDAFKNLLEYTNLGSAATNNGPYNLDISAKYLAPDFVDYSDSINFMAHFPLGGMTFPSRAVFDQQQGGYQQPLIINDVLTNFGCNHITWKWNAITPLGASVMGINHFIISDDLTQIKINHAEFNSGNWIDSFKVYGTVPAINCQTPVTSSSNSTSSNSTVSSGSRRMRF